MTERDAAEPLDLVVGTVVEVVSLVGAGTKVELRVRDREDRVLVRERREDDELFLTDKAVRVEEVETVRLKDLVAVRVPCVMGFALGMPAQIA